MRPIDAETLTEGLELHRQATDQEYETDRQWAVGYNAGLDRALYSIVHAKTVTPLPNAPLTLEELREMDREPVWIERCGSDSPDDREWALVDLEYEMCRTTCGGLAVFEMYGKTWLAYRRKPEDKTT